MLVWLVDDDHEMLTGFNQLVSQGVDLPDTLNIDLTTIKRLADFEIAIQQLATGDLPVPDLIFLDLKFRTTREGYIALDMIKNHHMAEVRSIPTIMFSSGKDDVDVKKAYRKSVNAYVEKGSQQYEKFAAIVGHWAEHTSLPSESA